MTWRVPCLAAAAILAGSWLLWLSLTAVAPLPPSGPQQVSMRYSVTPGYSSRPETRVVPTAVPIATPPVALVNDPCMPYRSPKLLALRHWRCPTLVPSMGYGSH